MTINKWSPTKLPPGQDYWSNWYELWPIITTGIQRKCQKIDNEESIMIIHKSSAEQHRIPLFKKHSFTHAQFTYVYNCLYFSLLLKQKNSDLKTKNVFAFYFSSEILILN